MHATERKLYKLLNGKFASKVKKKKRITIFEEDPDQNIEFLGERKFWKAAICAGLLDYLSLMRDLKLHKNRMGTFFNQRKDYRFKEQFLTSWLENKHPTAQDPRPLAWILDLLFENSDEMHNKIVAKIKKVAKK